MKFIKKIIYTMAVVYLLALVGIYLFSTSIMDEEGYYERCLEKSDKSRYISKSYCNCARNVINKHSGSKLKIKITLNLGTGGFLFSDIYSPEEKQRIAMKVKKDLEQLCWKQ